MGSNDLHEALKQNPNNFMVRKMEAFGQEFEILQDLRGELGITTLIFFTFILIFQFVLVQFRHIMTTVCLVFWVEFTLIDLFNQVDRFGTQQLYFASTSRMESTFHFIIGRTKKY